MEKRIYKYRIPFGVVKEVPIDLPKGAKIICVAAQYDEPCLLAIVDMMEKKETRTFEVYGTGHEIEGLREGVTRIHIGTFFVQNTQYEFHVFEIIPITFTQK